jgi:hypothetical protein
VETMRIGNRNQTHSMILNQSCRASFCELHLGPSRNQLILTLRPASWAGWVGQSLPPRPLLVTFRLQIAFPERRKSSFTADEADQ